MSRVQIYERDGQVFELHVTLDAETLAAMLAPWSMGASGVVSEESWLAVTANAQSVHARARSPFLAAVAARFRAHPKCRMQTENIEGSAQLVAVTAVLTSAHGFVGVKVHAPEPFGDVSCSRVHVWALSACEFPTRAQDYTLLFTESAVDTLFHEIDDFLTGGVPVHIPR